MMQTHTKAFLFYETMGLELCIFFRLNIPPFVPARTALEGLESEDYCENEKPVKNEITDTKVKEHRRTVFRSSDTHPNIFLTVPFFLMCIRSQTELNRRG